MWVLVWGGPNCLAQALWKVKATRSESELKSFVSKLRVYAISDQDDSGVWIRKTFKDLFYISVRASIALADTITPHGAASAATSFTAALPGPTSALLTIRGSTSTYAARASWASSIPT